MTDFENVEQYLPESVKEIVEVIGLPDTEKLVKAFGGCSFQFARSGSYFARLKNVLGQDVAIKLQRYMGGCEVYIPRCETALRILRNQRLYADFCQLTELDELSGSLAILKLCPKYNISDRTAWEVVRYYQQGRKQIQTTLF